MHVPTKNISILPLHDQRIQIIIIPLSTVKDLGAISLQDKIKMLIKDIDETVIKKYKRILLPSFSVEIEN